MDLEAARVAHISCGKTLILVRAASRCWESTGLWVGTPSWQRLPHHESTHTHKILLNECHGLQAKFVSIRM